MQNALANGIAEMVKPAKGTLAPRDNDNSEAVGKVEVKFITPANMNSMASQNEGAWWM